MNISTIIAQTLLSATLVAMPMVTTPKALKTVPSHKNIVFDVGDVLVRPSKGKAFKQFSCGTIINYSASLVGSGNNPLRFSRLIKHRFFDILNELEPLDTTEPCPRHGNDDQPMPMIMRFWMRGTLSSADIIQRVNTFIDEQTEKFANASEQKLIRTIARITFKPSVLAHTLKLKNNMADFARLCKKEGHKIYILSNFDSESFALLRRKYSNFFALFDGIFISGDAQCIKPEAAIYIKFLSEFNLQAEECLFIDDRPENVVAARKVGMYACQYDTKKERLSAYPEPAHAYA